MSNTEHTRIKLNDERQRVIVDSVIRFFNTEFDESLSEFRAKQLLDFMTVTLGRPIYNQAVQDSRAFLFEKLDDLDAVLHEREG